MRVKGEGQALMEFSDGQKRAHKLSQLKDTWARRRDG